MKSYFTRILINSIYDFERKQKWEEPIEKHDYPDIESGTESLNFNDAILVLSKQQRLCVQLFYYESFSIKEISEMLSISNGTIKKQLSRSREKLKKLLANKDVS